MESEKGLSKAAFTKIAVAILEKHVDNPRKNTKKITHQIWDEILKVQGKAPCKRKSGRSGWSDWEKNISRVRLTVRRRLQRSMGHRQRKPKFPRRRR